MQSDQKRPPRQTVIDALHGGLVVRFQAPAAPFVNAADTLAWLAHSAQLGGAAGLRAYDPRDVATLLRDSSLPLIASNRRTIAGSAVRITPTWADASLLLDAGAMAIALDATGRIRPDGEHLRDIVRRIHAAGAVALGDLAGLDDLPGALAARVDAVGTTLSGRRDSTHSRTEPEFGLLEQLVRRSPVPVYAEGYFWTPDQVAHAFSLGAAFVVVGQAITDPAAITSRLVHAIPKAPTHP